MDLARLVTSTAEPIAGPESPIRAGSKGRLIGGDLVSMDDGAGIHAWDIKRDKKLQ